MNENEVKDKETEQAVALSETAPETEAPIETETACETSQESKEASDNNSSSEIWGAVELDRVLTIDEDTDEDTDEDSSVSSAPKYRKGHSARRGFPYFYVIYAAFVLLAVAGIAWACSFVNTLLTEYESVQPKYVAEQVFTEHFKNVEISELLNLADSDFAEFETKESVIAHLTEKIMSGEITYSESLKTSTGEQTYNVYSDGKRFATFSLAAEGESTEHGFRYYVLKDKKLVFELPDSSYLFVLPDRYTLYVNGIAVSDKYKTGNSTPTDAYKITGGKSGVNYVEYSVGGFLTQPTFSVKDESGADASYYWDEERELFTADMKSVTLRIPQGYVAYIDGCEVGEQLVLSDKAPTPSAYNKFLSEGTEGISYIEYKIGGFYQSTQPEIAVKSADGYDAGVYYVEKEALFECYPAYNTSLKSEYEAQIKEFFRKYTLCLICVDITADGKPMALISQGSLKPYFDTAGNAWSNFKSVNINSDWQFQPKWYEFADEIVDEFISYPDGTFSCRVKQTYNSWRTASASYSQNIDKTVFYKIVNDKILIYELTNTSAVQGVGQPNA